MAVKTTKKIRDADATQARILTAAKKEFARSGLGGARVDEIADRAKASKRMIYHYFGNKEDLFRIVLEDAYTDIRTAEQALEVEHLPAREALDKLIRFAWDYYLKNPEFITLINSENLHKARYLKQSDKIEMLFKRFVGMVGALLERGVEEGVFRPRIDPVQMNITIAAIGYYYLTNRFTGSIVSQRKLMTPEALEERMAFNIETIMRLVCVDP